MTKVVARYLRRNIFEYLKYSTIPLYSLIGLVGVGQTLLRIYKSLAKKTLHLNKTDEA